MLPTTIGLQNQRPQTGSENILDEVKEIIELPGLMLHLLRNLESLD
jgi:hypothetical protein